MPATCLPRNFAFIICVAIGPIPGRPSTRFGIGTGIGIAGLPSGETLSRCSKSLWMMFSP